MIKAIIVDDEKRSHTALSNLLKKGHSDIKIIASGYGVKEGLELVAAHRPNLVFLDIEMPDGTGFDFLGKIDRPDFQVIFITAHNEYAQAAIRFGALDYLLKPIGEKPLSEALLRAREKQEEKDKIEQWKLAYEAFRQFNQKKQPSRMSVSTMEGIHFVPVKNIMRFKAGGNTTDIYIKGRDKPLIACVNIGEYVAQFKSYPEFMQTHRSHMVNLKYVEKYIRSDGGYAVMEDGTEVPVSRGNRDGLLGGLGGL